MQMGNRPQDDLRPATRSAIPTVESPTTSAFSAQSSAFDARGGDSDHITPPMGQEANRVARGFGGVWVRFFALLIDSFIVWVPTIIVGIVFALILGVDKEEAVGLVVVRGQLAYILVFMIYEAATTSTGGATWGKRLFGLRVIDEQGYKLSFGRAFGRSLAKNIPFACFIAIFSKKKQGLHDMIVSSYVVKV